MIESASQPLQKVEQFRYFLDKAQDMDRHTCTYRHGDNYHWQELPQISFLWQQKFCHDKCACHDKHVFVMTKHVFCHDKSMLIATKLVMTNICHDKHVFVTKVLSSQAYFCHDKRHVLS